MTLGALRLFSPPAWGWSVAEANRVCGVSVFPTRVGMVRPRGSSSPDLRRFPHPRGDGPLPLAGIESFGAFSPPAWGWSDQSPIAPPHHHVFPTRVGMVRRRRRRCRCRNCFPHPRGDGPPGSAVGGQDAEVFPTRVGMVRRRAGKGYRACRFPHPRGDGPPCRLRSLRLLLFSPPAWGWSAVVVGCDQMWRCFPHPRGDGPVSVFPGPLMVKFSPPAWGWSEGPESPMPTERVFPTRVGMVRRARARRYAEKCFPHPRGDGPNAKGRKFCFLKFSPPAWGWSAWSAVVAWMPRFSPPAWGWSSVQGWGAEGFAVFPTRVGMVRRSSSPATPSGVFPTRVGMVRLGPGY